jgi:chemotaxis protein methyltransferase WspC
LLGLLHQSKQEWQPAGEAFRKVLYLDPNHIDAMFHLAFVYEQRGETAQAAILRQRIDRQRGTNL